MPSSSVAPVQLYEHPPSSLLPLLRSQLPHTIGLVSTILANRHSDSDPSPVDADDVRVPPPLPAILATFPPPASGAPSLSYLASLGIGPHDWLVAVALPPPSEQFRFYHSLEAAIPPVKEAGMAQAEDVVEGALREMVARYPDQLVAGCTHEIWLPVARCVLGGKDVEPTLIYLGRGGGFGHTEVDAPPPSAWEDELVLDHGRERDKSLIFSLNHYRREEYYAARAAHITLLRQKVGVGEGRAPPEAFVQCHGDGSTGALHTQPAFRRRGLAKVVLKAHLDKYEAIGVPAYCYIEEYNEASIALFESLGWTRLPWSVYWVFEKSVQDESH